MEKNAFAQKMELLRSKLNIMLRKRIVKCFLWSVVLYGSETWTLLQEDKNMDENDEGQSERTQNE